jgi:hypothetical protein
MHVFDFVFRSIFPVFARFAGFSSSKKAARQVGGAYGC